MIRRFSVVFLLLSGIFFFGHPERVLACTQPPSPTPGGEPVPPITIADRIESADIVLVGTVISVDSQSPYNEVAEVEVERYLKGDGVSIVHIGNFGYSSLCLTTVREGSHYIFIAYEDADGQLQASYARGGSPVINPSEENIAEITGITNHDVVPTPLTVEETATETAGIYSIPVISALSLLLIALIAVLSYKVIFQRDKRKSKAKRS